MLLPSWEILVNDPLFNSITLKIILVRHWHNILFDLYWPFATQTHFDLLRLRMFQFNPFLSNSVSTLRAPLRLLTDSGPFESHDVNFESFGRPSFPSSIIAQLSNVLTPTCESYVLRLISLGICKCRRFFFRAFLFILKFFFQFLTTQNLGSVLIAKGNGQTGSDVNLCIAAVV